jgi:glycosyltransferase involved in cell wall biosynthesis
LKRVLIITYYWPPGGGAGVQRWLKFVKYLRGFGWDPIVYTPENPEIPVKDESLMRDIPGNLTVLKTKIREPYDLYRLFIGRKKEEKTNTGFLSEKKKPGIAEKTAVWIRGNFFIPDARKFWIRPSVKFLSRYLSQGKVNAMVSTGPPHSMHLIALKLKQELRIPWLADFRDPWTNIDFYEDLMLTKFADKKHHRLEKQVLQTADGIITVSGTTNGYDEEDVFSGEVIMDKKFSLSHIGTLVPSRNPVVLWKVLSRLIKENKDFANDLEIKFVGKVDYTVIESIEKAQLKNFVTKIDYLPHKEVVKFQQQSQVLLLLANNTKNAKGILTGKFFEYLSAKRPVLAIGDEKGDMAEILAETNAGKISGFSDEACLRKNILEYYEKYKKGALACESTGIEKYSRKELTKKLALLLEKLVQ